MGQAFKQLHNRWFCKAENCRLGNMVRLSATNIMLATIIFGNTKQGESLIELTVDNSIKNHEASENIKEQFIL
jgi:hypothetical protein